MSLTDVAVSGPLLLAVLLALAAGAVSFASPCCVPLVPGYLAYLAGLVGADAPTAATAPTATDVADAQHGDGAARGQWRVVGAALLFVLGFTVVFSAGVVGALGVSDVLFGNAELLQRIGGVITVGMGLVFLGWIPALQREVRVHRVPRGGIASAPLLGAVYGLGWTPCLGPTLTGVIALSTATEVGPSAVRGLVLVLAYSLGLGLPFVLLAAGARWAVGVLSWLRRHVRGLQISGGIMLIGVGLLLATGAWAELVAVLRAPIAGYSTPL